MLSIKVTLISGRTSQQGVGLEVGKTSDQYYESVTFIELSSEDADVLGIEDGATVAVSTVHGSVIVRAKRSTGLDKGLAFFPYGPWANQIFGTSTGGTGMPQYKGVEADIEPAGSRAVPSIAELLEGLRGGA